MSVIRQHKVVAALPAPLEANSLYYVRAGTGFDVYVTNSTGLIAAYNLNASATLDAIVPPLLGAIAYNTDMGGQAARAVTDVIGTERAVEQLLGQAVYNADLVGQLVRLLTADTMALKGLSVTALDINADTLRLRSTRTPAAADAAGEAGECCWDADYLYLCVATNTWKRTPLTTW